MKLLKTLCAVICTIGMVITFFGCGGAASEEEVSETEQSTVVLAETSKAITQETEKETKKEEKQVFFRINEYYDGDNLWDTNTYTDSFPDNIIQQTIDSWDIAGYDYIGEYDVWIEEEESLYVVNLYFEKRIEETGYYTVYADDSGSYNTSPVEYEVYEGEIYELAEATYGIPRWQTARALRLMSYEGYGLDPTLVYYLACTIVNRFIDYGMDCDIYSAWGGGDSSYGSWLDDYGMYDSAVSGLAAALNNLDRNAWDVHGMCPENGYYGGCQHLDEAIYVSYVYCDLDYSGCVFACWPRSAVWY